MAGKRMSPQDFAAKWATRSQNASQAYQDGVNAVTQAPGQAAAAAADKWANNVANARNKFQQNVGDVSLQDWKTAAVQKGSQRYGPGVTAAQPKMVQKAGEFLGKTYDVADQVNQMPSTTLDQRINKSVEYQRRRAQAG